MAVSDKPTPASRGPAQDALDMASSGANPTPTRTGIQGRSASPAAYNTSGMEGALGRLADKVHPPKRR